MFGKNQIARDENFYLYKKFFFIFSFVFPLEKAKTLPLSHNPFIMFK